jgi:hypothetical protein
MDIAKIIKENRPKLSDSSIKTYTTLIKSVCKNVFKDKEITEKDLNEDYEKVLEYYKDKPSASRKTYLSALFVLTQNKHYQNEMNDDIQKVKTFNDTQEKTETQRSNWLSQEKLDEVFNNLETNAKHLFKKTTLTGKEQQQLVDYILLLVMSGKYIAPRRPLDYTEFRIKGNIDKEKDNYMDKLEFVFNRYKTSKFYNQQRVNIPNQLRLIINKWIKINPTDYLLFDSNQNKLTSAKINQRFNKLFGGRQGSNSIRHLYLTSKYGYTIEQQKEMDKTAEDMGTSSAQITGTYIKK